MMIHLKTLGLISILFLSIQSCKNPVKKNTDKDENVVEISSENSAPTENSKSTDSLLMPNGIKIHWIKKNNGESIKDGDVVDIDYKVYLTDGKLIEGNHLLNKESFPFMVGFQMQTLGWDIALKEMKVGDKAEVFIPSALARGEKGIEGMIPPNSDNVVYIEIIRKRKPTRIVEGNKVWVFEENKNNRTLFNMENNIVFHAMTSSPDLPLFANSFRQNKPFSFTMKDAGLVPGLKKALLGSKKADRFYVWVKSDDAYGVKGYQDIVKPNQSLFYNIYVMDVY
ncbi:MAG: FKBP-type peptidyl-prolyl cis-trans isomerase [Psychromonas sp.]|jgi:FKBP-type peptidyl-prolyl cis-trans isomerase